jgi:anti-sigma B factor antagonist
MSTFDSTGARLVELGTALLGRRTTRPPPARSSSMPPRPSDAKSEMKCVRTDSETECFLRIDGVLDANTAPEIRTVFDAVVAGPFAVVTLDVEGLTMIDSSGVGAIVSLFKRVKAKGGDLLVKNVQGQPLAICKLLKLERVFGF